MNNAKQRVMLDVDDGLKKLEKNLKPMLKFKEMSVYQYADISKKLVRLTKWLPPVPTELQYLRQEYCRIKADRSRVCIAAIHNHMIALFVNDLTNGAFEALGDEN